MFALFTRTCFIRSSSNLILDEVLGIKDLRSDKRIDFVGGIRGLGELKKRVDSGEMKVALALYPVSMKQLMDIVTSSTPIGSLSLFVPVLAVRLYHLPPR